MKSREDFDSSEELYFYWYCEELKEKGYINEFYTDTRSFHLSSKVQNMYTKKMKTKDKKVYQTILHGHRYTPDFEIEWNIKAKNIFYKCLEDEIKIDIKTEFIADSNGFCFIEVKPPFDQNNMTRLAVINQKWTYDSYGDFVNITIPQKLFHLTFTPERYLKCDVMDKDRKISFDVRNLEEYINLKN